MKGKIKRGKEVLYSIEGRWDQKVWITDAQKVRFYLSYHPLLSSINMVLFCNTTPQPENKELFFDAHATLACRKLVARMEDQGPFESRKCARTLFSLI